ncbi:MAG: ABC transporter permease [Candidatus Geothermarchaeales archaeon]
MSRTLDETWVLTVRELKRWYRHKYAIVFTLITPLFWIGLFGKSFNLGTFFSGSEGLPEELASILKEFSQRIVFELFGTYDYFTFMVCGMLSILVLFTSMWSGMSIVWDRRLGFLNKLLVAPISTTSLVMSRVSSSVIRGMTQVLLIFTAAVIMGLKLSPDFGLLNLLGIFFALSLLSIGLSSIFVALSFSITEHETLVAMANMVNLPLMFASNALFPLKQMPQWLQIVARVNPITYCVNVVRGLVLTNHSSTLFFDYSVLVIFALAFFTFGVFLSNRILNR